MSPIFIDKQKLRSEFLNILSYSKYLSLNNLIFYSVMSLSLH